MLHLNDVTLRIAGHALLEQANVHIPAGHKVGLVGRNGSGKTSLLRLIAGELAQDGGEVRLRSGATVGTVAQEAPGGGISPLEAVLAADEERARLLDEAATTTDPYRIGEVQSRLAEIGAHAAPARAASILKGLGFDDEAQGRPLRSFSGGWRMRAALGAVLFKQPDLLLLDEPTNHLDLEASLWLEDHLRRYPRTLIIVSHDRDLLNRVPDRIVHLEQRALTLYVGGYDTFDRVRREKLELMQKERARVEERRRHMQAFVDRFRYKASKARQAQSRLKAIERLGETAAPPLEPEVELHFPAPEVPPPPLVTLNGVRAGYGDHVVLDRLDLRLDPDDRIALLGANGNGKSTFARLIAGRLEPMAGEVVRAAKLRVGFFAQHQIEDLDPEADAISHLQRQLPLLREEQVRARLGAFGLIQDKAERPAKALSGGEKARLTLALVAARDPQILILDEPTNHLDIDSREALVEALNEFPGAVLLISHDRHLVELVADRLWLVANRRVRAYEGDLDDYRREVLDAARAAERDPGKAQASAERRRRAGDQKQRVIELRREARAAERELERIAGEHRALAARLADGATYQLSGPELEALIKREAELRQELEAAEAHWLRAEEALEAASA
ncbi:MAG: ABC-F family ATP-binding cassette domain-containing protein [Geminicoccaceae bacterium]|nr:ABC-F family ATP-binding cassette domain-containing protein [Geminicoccaceae bacterium]